MQCASNIFVIQPINFGFNTETANNNVFQQKIFQENIQEKIANEFNNFTKALTDHHINYVQFNDTESPIKPDAIFPNNWISLHANGTLVLYPMQATNRRTERRKDIVSYFQENYTVNRIIDLTQYEETAQYLEGTGSIVFDHNNKMAYANESIRTNAKVFLELCKKIDYQPIYFTALDKNGVAIYHTNVLMSIGQGIAIICVEAIKLEAERKLIIDTLTKHNIEIVQINYAQMEQFAGNMLMLQNKMGNKIMALSESAYQSLLPIQIIQLQKYCQLMPIAIPTIEKIGGGSIRCMIAENFLPKLY